VQAFEKKCFCSGSSFQQPKASPLSVRQLSSKRTFFFQSEVNPFMPTRSIIIPRRRPDDEGNLRRLLTAFAMEDDDNYLMQQHVPFAACARWQK
jgi:hypothetical protein